MKTNLLLFFLIIFFIGCKKPQHYYLSDNAKKYALFQIGSYWIYQNDSTFIIDSVYVDLLKQEITEWHYDKDVEYREHIDCYTKTVNDSDFKIIYQMEAFPESYTTYLNNFNGWVAGGIWLKSNGKEQLYTRFGAQIINPLNNFIVNGTAYNDVYNIKTDDNNSGFTPSLNAEVFIVKNIGILKWNIHYEDSSSVSYSLLRFHIVF